MNTLHNPLTGSKDISLIISLAIFAIFIVSCILYTITSYQSVLFSSVVCVAWFRIVFRIFTGK